MDSEAAHERIVAAAFNRSKTRREYFRLEQIVQIALHARVETRTSSCHLLNAFMIALASEAKSVPGGGGQS